MAWVMNKTPLERLWIKSERVPSGCVEWRGSRFKVRGQPCYGQMWYHGTNRKAHQVSWIEHFGLIPAGMCVLHSCDNKLCVNPDHLWLGTHTDNMRDMVAKGRKAIFLGETNGRHKLSAGQVLAIRNDRRTHAIIAADYGVCGSIIGLIKRRLKWCHV